MKVIKVEYQGKKYDAMQLEAFQYDSMRKILMFEGHGDPTAGGDNFSFGVYVGLCRSRGYHVVDPNKLIDSDRSSSFIYPSNWLLKAEDGSLVILRNSEMGDLNEQSI